MRVTNNMIMKNASSNIYGTKDIVNSRNTQMTTQKRINKPSDDPVIAIRSLRLSTTLSKVNQYYQKNIPDAQSWLDVTETALINIKELMTDARTLAVNGSTDTLTQTDRNTILTQLEKLQQSMFHEGNADYAGRTVFTGYRTDKELVFSEKEDLTAYSITQEFTADDLATHRYYYGDVEIPTSPSEAQLNAGKREPDPNDPDDIPVPISDIQKAEYYRIRLAYDGVEELKDENGNSKASIAFAKKEDDGTFNPGFLEPVVFYYDTIDDWAADTDMGFKSKTLTNPDTCACVFIRKTGEVIYSQALVDELKENNAIIKVDYTKAGFDEGDLRPEYYYNCVKTYDGPTSSDKDIEYKKFATVETTDVDANGDPTGESSSKINNFKDSSLADPQIHFDIEYTVAENQTVIVNTEASEVFDTSIQRDIGEMILVVKKSIAAHEKIDTIKLMKDEAQYASDASQEALDLYLAAAQKEADFIDNDLQKLFSSEIGAIDTYLAKVNLGITNLGCVVDSLTLTEKRMNNQQETVQELQSKNDDVDLSQIIIDYTAAYTAYQSSLTAAGKLGQQTLLNYI